MFWIAYWKFCANLHTIAEDPVKVGCEETEEEVEMNLVAETSHLPEYNPFDGCNTGGELSPEVDEDEDSNEECDDGHSVPKKEDEDLPLLHPTSMHVQWMVQAVSVVCIIIPGTIEQARLADVVCK